MTGALALAPRLDLRAAAPLAGKIMELRGGDMQIDAGAVTHLGGLCLQVLAAAAKTWREDGRQMTFSDQSEEFGNALAVFGLSSAALQSEPNG